MLTAAQRSQFDELGFTRVTAFSEAEAAAMQDALWMELSRVHRVERTDPASWRIEHAFGLKEGKTERRVFSAIGSTRLRGAIDDLLGIDAWDMPKRWGAFLVTFPAAGREWTVPHEVWHADFPFDLPAKPLPGVKLFVFVSDVSARMGGTLVVAGSHRLIADAVHGLDPPKRANTRRTRLHILASHPWLRALTSRADRLDRVTRFMERSETAGNARLQVVELTAKAGDVVLTHPWLLHCRASNSAAAPRFMRSVDIYRRELHPRTRSLFQGALGGRNGRPPLASPHVEGNPDVGKYGRS